MDHIVKMDKDLDELMSEVMKIKNRILRKELLEEAHGIKQKTASAVGVLRQGVGKLSSAQIAQLNDLAYKAIRKQGLQKQLDKRSAKNEELYKKLDNQLKKAAEKFNFDKIKEEHKELIEAIGSCPLSTCNLIESLE